MQTGLILLQNEEFNFLHLYLVCADRAVSWIRTGKCVAWLTLQDSWVDLTLIQPSRPSAQKSWLKPKLALMFDSDYLLERTGDGSILNPTIHSQSCLSQPRYMSNMFDIHQDDCASHFHWGWQKPVMAQWTNQFCSSSNRLQEICNYSIFAKKQMGRDETSCMDTT